jgi:hypothetical protein
LEELCVMIHLDDLAVQVQVSGFMLSNSFALGPVDGMLRYRYCGF